MGFGAKPDLAKLPPVVFLIDDDDLVRPSLERLLVVSGYRVESFASATEFLARAPSSGDGCIVTDLLMPEMSGLALQVALKAKECALPVIFITGHGEVPDAVQAMKYGAADFLLKPLAPEIFLATVGKAVQHCIRTRLDKDERERARALVQMLTPRELEVCKLVCQGMLNKQIAYALGTSEKTVKKQRGQAVRKLEANSAAGLVDVLRKAGL